MLFVWMNLRLVQFYRQSQVFSRFLYGEEQSKVTYHFLAGLPGARNCSGICLVQFLFPQRDCGRTAMAGFPYSYVVVTRKGVVFLFPVMGCWPCGKPQQDHTMAGTGYHTGAYPVGGFVQGLIVLLCGAHHAS